MGIKESTDPHDDLFQGPPSYDESSSSAFAGSSSSLDQVVSELREAGLESPNLIIGFDFTKTNNWTGYSLIQEALHRIGEFPNPYERAISAIAFAFSQFSKVKMISCFGFGDASTGDQDVFSFYPDNHYCHGFEDVLGRYRELVPLLNLKLSVCHNSEEHRLPNFCNAIFHNPEERPVPHFCGGFLANRNKPPSAIDNLLAETTPHLSMPAASFAPLIDAAIDIAERSNDQYHVLVIIADGQVTRNSDTPHGEFSPQEQATINSIVAASHYPLFIVLVGVGDGPWDEMQHFDDNIKHCLFDNFQFVDFTKIMYRNMHAMAETKLALAVLKNILTQYCSFLGSRLESSVENRIVQNLQVANRESIAHQRKRPLPPPKKKVTYHDDAILAGPPMTNFESVCPICLTKPKDMAFGCGHRTCKDCGPRVPSCPICREKITTCLRLYD